MTYSLSASTRLLLAMLLLIALAFQLTFSATYLMGEIYAHNGRISVEQKSWQDAVWFYDHAIDWYPHSHHWWFGKGQGHQGMFEFEKTIEAFNQAHALAPNHVSSIASLAYEVRDAGNPEDVQRLIDGGLPLAPHFWSLLYTKGLLQMRTGDQQKAGETLSLAQRYANQTQPLLERSVAYQALASGNLERAHYAIEKAVTANRSMPELWQLRGQILHSNDDPQTAVVSYVHAIDLYTKRMADQPATALGDARLRGETQAYLGFALAALGKDEHALENFAASTEQFVDLAFFGDAIDGMLQRLTEAGIDRGGDRANVLSAAGRHEAAIANYRGLEASDPAALSTRERYYYANALRRTGNPLAALEQYRKMPSMTWPEAMAYSETLLESGQPAAAKFEYTRILTLMQLTPQQRNLVEERIAALGQ